MLTLLQARTSSKRLPGKVMLPLLGRPMILRQLERVLRAEQVGKVVLVTSTDSSDDELTRVVQEYGVSVFRGSLDDVLDRFYHAAAAFGGHNSAIVRLTGDCPLADPEVIDRTIKALEEGRYDYVNNCVPATYPDGLDVEVFTYAALESAWREARLPSEREHVTPYIYNNPDRFSIGSVVSPIDYSRIRLTVDEPVDYELVVDIYTKLYPSNPAFNLANVIQLLAENPQLEQRNSTIQRNEGYRKSLLEDADWIAGKTDQS